MNVKDIFCYTPKIRLSVCGISDVIPLLKNVDCQVLCFVSSNKMSEGAGNLITILGVSLYECL